MMTACAADNMMTACAAAFRATVVKLQPIIIKIRITFWSREIAGGCVPELYKNDFGIFTLIVQTNFAYTYYRSAKAKLL